MPWIILFVCPSLHPLRIVRSPCGSGGTNWPEREPGCSFSIPLERMTVSAPVTPDQDENGRWMTG